MDQGPHRLFLGIPINDLFSQELLSFYKQQPKSDNIRWTTKNNLHVTLVFKGNTPSFLIPEIKNKLAEYFKGKPKIELKFHKYTVMPKSAPRMIWAQYYPDPLFKLMVSGVSNILKVPEARSPIPHITLARFKDVEIDTFKLDVDINEQTLPVHTIHLYESVLKPTGAEYKVLDTYTL